MTDTEKIADVVVAAVRAATAQLVDRIAVLETRAPVPGPAGRDGIDGKSGIDGKDAPVIDIEELALKAAALVPVPKDGRDGKDAPAIDLDELALKAADLIPKPKDGADGKDGRDGQPGVPGVPGRDGGQGPQGEKGMDGKDGRDGTLEGASIKQLDDRTWQIVRGDGSALSGVFHVPAVLDRGVYKATQTYDKGDGVTFGGSFWIAQAETSEKPGDGATKWRLAVKAGRDGREGKQGPQGMNGSKGEKGDPGRNFS